MRAGWLLQLQIASTPATLPKARGRLKHLRVLLLLLLPVPVPFW